MRRHRFWFASLGLALLASCGGGGSSGGAPSGGGLGNVPVTTQAWTVYSCDFGVYNIPKTDLRYSLAVR